MERNSYLVVEMSFIEWKFLYEELRQSIVPCIVWHESPLLRDTHTCACFLVVEAGIKRESSDGIFYNATLVVLPSSHKKYYFEKQGM